MAVSTIKSENVKKQTITTTIQAGAVGAGVYSSEISPNRVINIIPVFDTLAINHPIEVFIAHNHATRLCYVQYAKAETSTTETREYQLDVFYV